jgi:hypothetical protein
MMKQFVKTVKEFHSRVVGRDSRRWSFTAQKDATLLAPAILTLGTVTTTQFQNPIVGDATAKAAWQAYGLTPPITTAQFRIGSAGGPIYNIIAFDGNATLTLDRIYAEGSGSLQAYQIYKIYYPAPESGFVRWASIYDPINAYPLRLGYNKTDFDRWDPQRSAVSLPVYVGAYTFGPFPSILQNYQLPLFELWPGPTSQIGYSTSYDVRGPDLVNDADIQPYAIPDDLILHRARWRAYEWAEANKGSHPELQKTSWLNLMNVVDKDYDKLKLDVMRQDNSTFMTNYTMKWRGLGAFPNTGQFIAQHDVGDIFG